MAFTSKVTEYSAGQEIVRINLGTILGGVVLDMTGYTDEDVKAGHFIVHKVEEGKDIYKPCPVSDGAFASPAEGYEFAGVNIHTLAADEPFAAVLTHGEVNDKMLPYTLTDAIKAKFKADVPTVTFGHD